MPKKIKNGSFGNSGSAFITVRELAKEKKISLVTSQKVFLLLEKDGMIKCFNKKYYITSGRINDNCKLSEILSARSSFSPKPMIGMIVPNLENPFFGALIQKVSNSVIEHNCSPVIMSYKNDEKLESEMLNLLISMGVKGILSCPYSHQSVKKIYSKCILPVVLISEKFSNNEDFYSSVDNYSAAQRVAWHFSKMGYEEFMYIGTNLPTDEDMRYKGFFDQLEMMGIDVRDKLAFSMKEFKELPYYILQKIISAKKTLGVFCYHDIIAERVLYACKKHSISVPRDVGIVGFDDLPITTQVEPPLSTIAYSYDKIAKTTVEKLINRINRTENESTSSVSTVNSMLVVRDSSRRI